MNTLFQATANSSAKKQAQQLFIELGQKLTPQQKQSLLNIYQALDRSESSEKKQQGSTNLILTDDQLWQDNQLIMPEDFPQSWVQRVNRTRSK